MCSLVLILGLVVLEVEVAKALKGVMKGMGLWWNWT